MTNILIGIIVFLLSVGGAGFIGLDHGMKIKNAEWLEKEAKQQEKLAVELGKAMERVAKQNEQNEITLLRAINEKDNVLNRLTADLADARRVQFRVKAASCDGDALRGKTEGTGDATESTGGSGIRISGGVYQDIQVTEEELSDGIWELYRERETLKAYFKAVKSEVEQIVEVVE
jgi:hypothetical protein